MGRDDALVSLHIDIPQFLRHIHGTSNHSFFTGNTQQTIPSYNYLALRSSTVVTVKVLNGVDFIDFGCFDAADGVCGVISRRKIDLRAESSKANSS